LGFSNLSARSPLTPSHLFQIGSVSKSFTCAALLQLVDEGLVNLNAPVTDYLPWFKVNSKHGPITLHDLMTHTAGIIMGTDATPTGATEVWDLRYTEATTKPGTKFHYSNSGYKALGLALESMTGQTYSELIRERLLDPMGMKDTQPVITNDARWRHATAYVPIHDDRPYARDLKLAPATWFEGDTADGSICSNAEDMCRYMRMLLNRGMSGKNTVLTEKAFRNMTASHVETGAGTHRSSYGYGLDIVEGDGHFIIGHQGGMVGYYTSMLMDMDSGLGVVVLINGPGEPEPLASSAMSLLKEVVGGSGPLSEPAFDDPLEVPNAELYSGIYQSGARTITILPEEKGLAIQYKGKSSIMARYGKHLFYTNIEPFQLFHFKFDAEGGAASTVTHGDDLFIRRGHESPGRPEPPAEWRRYVGHYRSHNPWLTNFRVILRAGTLYLVIPTQEEEELAHIDGTVFRVGDDPDSPERIQFRDFVDGRPIRAILFGCGDYGRSFNQ